MNIREIQDRTLPHLTCCFGRKSKILLRCCVMSIHDLTRRYYYRILAEESIPFPYSSPLLSSSSWPFFLPGADLYFLSGDCSLASCILRLIVASFFQLAAPLPLSFCRETTIKQSSGDDYRHLPRRQRIVHIAFLIF